MIRPLLLVAAAVLPALAGESAAYLEPSAGSPAVFTRILSVGESGAAGQPMSGIPDGLGAFGNQDGTFTLLMNHEIGPSNGATRAHGRRGAFVSRWVINESTLAVQSITDHNPDATSIHLWDAGTGSYLAGGTTTYGRLCSADLPDLTAFYNPATGLGTTARLYLNGEEVGAEGRAFAHIVSGANQGRSYELPHLGKASWENQLASPFAQNRTVVIGLDDTTPGQVYVYVGMKASSGTEVERAGLVGGTLYGIRANGSATESVSAGVGAGKGVAAPFALVSLGNASASTGAQIQTASVALGITEFLRPEDGAWDPLHPRDFYFVTTHQFDGTKNGSSSTVGRSRLWRLRFHDIADPAAGGTIAMLLDGTEPQQMFDNMCMDRQGRIILQEDPGNQQHSARIWSYDVTAATLTEVGKHKGSIFGDRIALAGGGFADSGTIMTGFTRDEESSGVIDASAFLGDGAYLMVVQAHGSSRYTNGQLIGDLNNDGDTLDAGEFPLSDVAEGGQLLLMRLPVGAVPPVIQVAGNGTEIMDGDSTPASADHTDFGSITIGAALTRTYTISNPGFSALLLTGTPKVTVSPAGAFAVTVQPATSVAPGAQTTFSIACTPVAAGAVQAVVSIASTDPAAGRSPYTFAIAATALAAPGPEIAVSRSGTGIADGGTDAVGAATVGTAKAIAYSVANQGSAALLLSGSPVAAISSPVNCTASVSTQPAASIAAGGSSTLVVQVTPSATGAWSCAISMATNDSDEQPMNWTISGVGLAAPLVSTMDFLLSGPAPADAAAVSLAAGGVVSQGAFTGIGAARRWSATAPASATSATLTVTAPDGSTRTRTFNLLRQ